ncbi:hypothetical protein LTR08_004674 [Meristemomyces frigidus]|nr:hypothetical protein LTR08_004674 [Meristemomyces frigidus]
MDLAKETLKEAYHFTPILSGFIKIAQMLEKAGSAVQAGVAAHPADLLDEMRARFLIHGTRSPFSWASQLRMYGRKVRDSTTCLGYISWSENNQAVSYKAIHSLSMEVFRDLIAKQVAEAQEQLEGLLLLHPQEKRDDLELEFRIYRIIDDASENRKGWSFLQHPQNLDGILPNRDNWLLDRILECQWLQEEFFHESCHNKKPHWNQKAVQAYLLQVDSFLERLLLLVHLTGCQPARGTEILSLRHMNTVNGHHRNVFVENGMVSTVTTYHKGYNATGSTKIIHRYLPKEVGELLVYYVWIIRPGVAKLRLLAQLGQGPAHPSSGPRRTCGNAGTASG